MTLVEMLVATVITLLLVYGLTQAFAVVSETVTTSRAVLELAGGMRGVTYTLHQDLAGITVPARPWPAHAAMIRSPGGVAVAVVVL